MFVEKVFLVKIVVAVKLCLFGTGKDIEWAIKPETRDEHGADVICWIRSSNIRYQMIVRV